MHENQGYEIDQILQEMRTDYWRNLEAVEEGAGGYSVKGIRSQGQHAGMESRPRS